jgi:hypothetical protein
VREVQRNYKGNKTHSTGMCARNSLDFYLLLFGLLAFRLIRTSTVSNRNSTFGARARTTEHGHLPHSTTSRSRRSGN